MKSGILIRQGGQGRAFVREQRDAAGTDQHHGDADRHAKREQHEKDGDAGDAGEFEAHGSVR